MPSSIGHRERWPVVPNGEAPDRDWDIQPGPNIRCQVAIEEQVSIRLHSGARGANIRGGSTFVEEVGMGTQAVNVGEVGEDLQLRWEVQGPGHASGCVPGADRREHTVCLTRAETRRRGRVDEASRLNGRIKIGRSYHALSMSCTCH
jgi:hypothetical protein